MTQNYFIGDERLEVFAPTGKPMRMGQPEELNISDYKKINDFIEEKNFEDAYKYLSVVEIANTGMFALLTQWAIQFIITSKKYLDPSQRQELLNKSYEHFTEQLQTIEKNEDNSNVSRIIIAISQVFHPDNLNCENAYGLQENLQSPEQSIMIKLSHTTVELMNQTKVALDEKNYQSSKDMCDDYYRSARALHDSIVQYTNSYPTVAYQLFGQEIAEKLVQHSFIDAPFFPVLWGLADVLSPSQLAAFLLEHLRDHFSGEDRGGSAKIIEHFDRYQLIFDPCGSGGALRRRCKNNDYILQNASPGTFNIPNAVPLYCTHCAFNAITSIERFGFPIYVTEFNTDPDKPCGWTVYKDPQGIPEKYFENVGCKKDESKFKREW